MPDLALHPQQASILIAAMAETLRALSDRFADLREVLHYAKRRALDSGLELGRPDALDGLGLTPDDIDAVDLPDGPPPTARNLTPASEVDLGGLEEIAKACQAALQGGAA